MPVDRLDAVKEAGVDVLLLIGTDDFNWKMVLFIKCNGRLICWDCANVEIT